MISTFLIILPIFGLIFAGWLVRKIGVLGPHAAGELNRFVVYLALPALLFDIMSRVKFEEIWQPGFITSFSLGCGLVFAITLAIRWRAGLHLADASVDALASSYANTGYIGFPLAVAVFGAKALTPTLIASILTVCVIFAVAIVLIEIGIQKDRRISRLITKVSLSVLKNPLLVAPLLGAIFPLTSTEMPAAGGSLLKLLGGAASPCALVSLGLFLAEKKPAAGGSIQTVGLLIALKLILQPAIVWIFAALVFRLPAEQVQPAVLLAALPTGTGPFMLAEFYQREAGTTSKVILGSTLLSVLTITIYLSTIG